MQEQEAEKAIDISGCKLRENQVFVIWKWKWYDPDSGNNSGLEDETRSVSQLIVMTNVNIPPKKLVQVTHLMMEAIIWR